MLKPIPKIIIVLLVSLGIVQLVYMFLDKGLNHYNVFLNEKLDELLVNKTDHQILFLGSSRMQTSVDPRIIDTICGVNSFNAGTEGARLPEVAMLYEAYLENHPSPKITVMSIEMGSFNLNRNFFNHLQYFSYLDNKIVDESLNENGHPTSAIKLFPFLKLLDYDDDTRARAFKGLLGKIETPTEGEINYKGYHSNGKDSIQSTNFERKQVYIKMDEAAIKAMDRIIAINKKKNIPLIITYPPEFQFEAQKRTYNEDEFFALMYSKTKENNITYWRHDSLDIGLRAGYFANPGHLNAKGAIIYSKILGQLLENSN